MEYSKLRSVRLKYHFCGSKQLMSVSFDIAFYNLLILLHDV